MIYNNTSLVHQSNFLAATASYLDVLNTNLIKTNTTMHALKLFLTSKQKLHEVTCQPQFLGSFDFQKAWIGGQESAFEIDKRALGMEGNTTAFSMLLA